MFNEEKDYVFLKKLNIFYIDRDASFQKILKENVKDFIIFTMCDSINTALKNFESARHDVILCDMSFPYEQINDFFKRFSNEIPIIAISSSNGAKVAYNAARLGARDYLQKNELDFKMVPKILHNIYLNWVKDKERKYSMQLLDDPNIRIILKDLINTDLPINQSINSILVNEIPINETIKHSYNVNINEILEKHPDILKPLTKNHFILQEYVEQTLACQNCKSVNIIAHYFCDKCKSSQFQKAVFPVHIKCGKISISSSSQSKDNFFCQHCMMHFENTFSECNQVTGFQCIKCKNSFINPSMSFSCRNCNLEGFDINQGNWVRLYRYRLNKENLNKIKKNIFLLMQLEESLLGLGFTIKQYEKLTINNNTFGPFELIANKDNKILIFTILNNDLQYNLRRIFEIDVASKTTEKEIVSFAIEFFELQDVILKLLDRFGIIPIVEEDTDSLIKEIIKYL